MVRGNQPPLFIGVLLSYGVLVLPLQAEYKFYDTVQVLLWRVLASTATAADADAAATADADAASSTGSSASTGTVAVADGSVCRQLQLFDIWMWVDVLYDVLRPKTVRRTNTSGIHMSEKRPGVCRLRSEPDVWPLHCRAWSGTLTTTTTAAAADSSAALTTTSITADASGPASATTTSMPRPVRARPADLCQPRALQRHQLGNHSRYRSLLPIRGRSDGTQSPAGQRQH